ncbi:MAG: hypothetical protein R3F59_28245 [Myxococcota bacterium]
MIPPVYDESEIPERLRRLLAAEISRIVEDLAERQIFLIETWGRHRDRGPLLDTIFSRWRTLAMTDLALLDSEAIAACEAFYRDLDELRLYFQFTQDMPSTLEQQYERALERVAVTGSEAVTLLGGSPPTPTVTVVHDDGEEVAVPRLSLLAPPDDDEG